MPRHAAVVRIAHWTVTLCALALLVSGIEILISHPRFYWGENGTSLTTPLFSFPIPSSRRTVPTGYGYVLPDQNGWSRYLHFEAAWALVLIGALYVIHGLFSGHIANDLSPLGSSRSTDRNDTWTYNRPQRLTYLAVILLMFPLIVWTGLAMSPAFVSAIPATVTLLGGRQTARTLHFFLSVALVLFVIGHVAMVWRAGFVRRVTAMITGRSTDEAL
jgi:thiosulfate reductase cytochrome b subunit